MVKTTVTLPVDVLDHARSVAQTNGSTVSDVLRRAAELARYVEAATKDGEKLLIERSDKTLRELVIIK
jgi:hypothetical protein